MNDNVTLDGAEIRIRRLEKGWSQAKLAFVISRAKGVVLDPSTVSYWENEARMPGADNLMYLAEALGCAVRDIIRKKEVASE